MFPLPDPAELDALAERIADQAAAARERAGQLGGAVAALGWHGVAAIAFRGEAHVVIAALRAAAGRLDGAADALHRHAGKVRALGADLKDLGIDGARTAEDLVLHPGSLVADAGDLVSDGADLVGDALGLIGL
jgi:uncharacterized protein YukE